MTTLTKYNLKRRFRLLKNCKDFFSDNNTTQTQFVYNVYNNLYHKALEHILTSLLTNLMLYQNKFH